MTELTLTLIKLAFLAVLWLFVIAAVGVIRADLFGTTPKKKRSVGGAKPEGSPPRAAQPPRGRRGDPSKVVVMQGPRSGVTINLQDMPIVLGRANDATLALHDDYASGRHARLFPQDGQWMVEDLGSTNGTYLGHAKVSRPTPAPVGVPIRVGKTVLELRK